MITGWSAFNNYCVLIATLRTTISIQKVSIIVDVVALKQLESAVTPSVPWSIIYAEGTFSTPAIINVIQ